MESEAALAAADVGVALVGPPTLLLSVYQLTTSSELHLERGP